MSKIVLKIKDCFIKKENGEVGEKFIAIMEIIYAIILACGVIKIAEIFEKHSGSIPLDVWFSIFIAILVLIRFSFAPSKNIKILGKRAKGWKWTIMPFDVTLLITHAFIFYFMCLKIKNHEIFYRYFFILLIVNSFWLFTIGKRLKKENTPYNTRLWCINNFIFFLLYLSTYQINLNSWVPWFILAFLNSFIDILSTYPAYFED